MSNRSRRDALKVGISAYITIATRAAFGNESTSLVRAKEQKMTYPDDTTLHEMAKRAKAISKKAYCPYSKFNVGAVVLSQDGQMFEGCNVENASYGLTICAERNAIFQMVAHGKQQIAAVVVYTPTPTPSASCGACRQVINEFGPDAIILSTCDSGQELKKKLSHLLPDAFGPRNLAK